MASMKRLRTDLLALGFAAAVTSLCAERRAPEIPGNSKVLAESRARAESALYLEGAATLAHLDRTRDQWVVTDGRDIAWLDARSGQLVALELGPEP
jgi:hypothetical protein